MAQGKRAGPITQRWVDRSYLLLNILRNIANEQIAKYSDVMFVTLPPYFNVSIESNNFKNDSITYQQDGAREGCWAHNPEVGRSELPPAKYFYEILLISKHPKIHTSCLSHFLHILT